MRRLPLVLAAVVAVVLLAGCASYHRLRAPEGARWISHNQIWVPTGEARAVASIVCDGGDSDYDVQPYRDGELVECTYAVLETNEMEGARHG